ncbi:MAG: sensor histidine kinase [Bacteroidetes bacterium]|nr:sensor histidine kinase [Bacteroidota bacterium]
MQDKSHMLIILFLVVVIFLVLVLLGFIITILFLHQRKRRRFAKELEKIKANYEKELFKAQLEMQEETFQYISREIHDNVGQFLSLAKLNLNTLDFEDIDLTLELINHSSDLLTRALEDLRDLSKSLSSDIIKNGGLQKAIELQVSQLQKTGKFRVIYDIKGNYQFLNEQNEIILFRILQEAVNNIIRHSCAREIIILLSCIENNVKMYIQDNGKGFDIDFLSNRKNHPAGGINNMQKRARLINADLDIKSDPGKGTRITVTTPL